MSIKGLVVISGFYLCRFYSNGRHILSAGQDRAFRLFSVIQVRYDTDLVTILNQDNEIAQLTEPFGSL